MPSRIEPYSLSLFWRGGIVVAAMRETKTVITDDNGNVIHEQPNPAEEIPNDLGEEILGEVNAGLLAQVSRLQKEHAEQSAAYSARIAELEAALAAKKTP